MHRCRPVFLFFIFLWALPYSFASKSGCNDKLKASPYKRITRPISSRPKQKAIVIIDPFGHNAGELLHKYALERNIKPIFVFSTPIEKWPANYQKFAELKKDFTVIEHNGNTHQTIQQVIATAQANDMEIIAALPGLEGYAIPLFDKITQTLKIPSNGTKYSQARILKSATQKRLKDANLGYIEKTVVRLKDEEAWLKIRAAASRLFAQRKTVIIKPDMGAATTYIFRCKNVNEVKQAYQKITSHPYFLHKKIETVNIEERLEGPEYIYDTVRTTVIRNGKEETLSVLTGVWVYKRAPSADPLQTDIIDTVEWIPAEQLPIGLVEYAEKALDALSIKFGPTHLEIFHTPNGFRVVDFNARLPGSSPLISSAATGDTRNQVSMSVESVISPNDFYKKYSRQNPTKYKTAQHAVVLHLNVYKKGKYPNIEELKKLSERYKNIYYESKIFPTNEDAELPLTVDLFTPLLKIHLLGPKDEVERAVAEIKADHERGTFFSN